MFIHKKKQLYLHYNCNDNQIMDGEGKKNLPEIVEVKGLALGCGK